MCQTTDPRPTCYKSQGIVFHDISRMVAGKEAVGKSPLNQSYTKDSKRSHSLSKMNGLRNVLRVTRHEMLLNSNATKRAVRYQAREGGTNSSLRPFRSRWELHPNPILLNCATNLNGNARPRRSAHNLPSIIEIVDKLHGTRC